MAFPGGRGGWGGKGDGFMMGGTSWHYTCGERGRICSCFF